jgi:phage-related baseplate assembly protein
MSLQEELQRIEAECVAVWDYLVGSPSQPGQLERLYLKVLAYLVAFFLNARKAIANKAKPGIIRGCAQDYADRVKMISTDIADVGITNPSGNNVVIHLLAVSGQPSATLLNLVQNTMQNDFNKILCDVITVEPATAINYRINASLTLYATANKQKVLDEATRVLTEYSNEKRERLGEDIIRTDLIDILRDIVDIRDVNLTQPLTNVVMPPQSYGSAIETTLEATIIAKNRII